MKSRVVLVIAMVHGVGGCSLLINGTDQKMTIESGAPNSIVVVENRWNNEVIAEGAAPLNFVVARGERNLVAKVSAAGYGPVSKNLDHRWSGYCGLDLLFPWAIVPALVTGSCYTFDDISIEMIPDQAGKM